MKKPLLLSLSLIFVSVFNFTGCATNGYEKFYTPFGDNSSIPPLAEGEEPVIVSVAPSDEAFREAADRYKRNNYRELGVSSFTSGDTKRKELVKHAKKIGATVVIHASKFLRTHRGVMPLTTYNPGTTTYQNFSGNVGGSNFYGTGSTYTPGTTSTEYIPYSVDRYSYDALFLRQSEKRLRFGFIYRDLTSEERQKHETNKGVKISLVIKQTAAYQADLLEGDVLLKIDGERIEDSNHWRELVGSFPSQKIDVVLEVLRKGSRKSITLHLPAK